MSITIREIILFCDRQNIKHGTFGRRCNGDPSLIPDIANGRNIGHALEARIRVLMAAIEGGEPDPTTAPKFKRTTPAVRGRRPEATLLHDAMGLIVQRDPCWNCAVRHDLHDEMGCRRWRAGE